MLPLPAPARPGGKVKICQGQRGARTKLGEPEGYLGRTGHRSPRVRPTTARPSLFLLESLRLRPVTLPRLGSEATPLPDPARLCGSDLWPPHSPSKAWHQLGDHTRPASLQGLPGIGDQAGTSHHSPGGRERGPSAFLTNIFAHSCTLITHSHPHMNTFVLRGS